MAAEITNKLTDEQRLDGWLNAMSGLGVAGKDKRTSAQAYWLPMSEIAADAIYSGDDIFPRIVDELPNEAFREGYDIKTDATAAAMKALGADVKMHEACIKARQYGGAAILKVTKNGAPMDKPMGKDEQIKALIVLSRWELPHSAVQIDTDFESPNFGYPAIYQIQLPFSDSKNTQQVHWTRIIRFHGAMLPRRMFISNNYWHDSVMNRLYNAVRNYQQAHDASAAIVQDFNVSVWKMKNLAEMLSSPEGEAKLRARVNAAQFSKSVIKGVVIDADMEDWQEKARTVTGLPEVLSKIGNRLVAATDMPHTKLLGESPQGSNSTGNSTTMGWYDVVAAWQKNYLTPKWLEVAKAVNPAHPEDDLPKFRALWQMDDKERSAVNLAQSTADRNYIESGVLDPDECAVSRFGGEDGYSLETEITTRDPKPPEPVVPAPANPAPVDPNAPVKPPAKDPKARTDSKPRTHALILSKAAFSKAEAGEWVKANGFSLANAAESDSEYRFVQEDVSKFKPETMATVELKHGVKSMVAHMLDEHLQDPGPDENDPDDQLATGGGTEE